LEKKSVELIIRNKLGLHARAAALLVQLTNRFEYENRRGKERKNCKREKASWV